MGSRGSKSPFHLLFTTAASTPRIGRDMKGLYQNWHMDCFWFKTGITICQWCSQHRPSSWGSHEKRAVETHCTWRPELPDLSGPHLAWGLWDRSCSLSAAQCLMGERAIHRTCLLQNCVMPTITKCHAGVEHSTAHVTPAPRWPPPRPVTSGDWVISAEVGSVAW